MKRLFGSVLALGAAVVGVRPAIAGAWIPATKDKFAAFQKALRENNAEAILGLVDPTTQAAADNIAARVRDFAGKASDADRGKAAEALGGKPEDLAKFDGKAVFAAKPFRDAFAHVIKAQKVGVKMNGGKHLIKADFTSDGKPYSLRIEAPSREALSGPDHGGKYRLVLALPDFPVP